MLLLCPNPTFVAPVKITIPGEDAPAVLKLQFRHRDKDQLKALMAKTLDPGTMSRIVKCMAGIEGDPVEVDTLLSVLALIESHATDADDIRIVLDIVAGWPEGPQTPDGLPVAFTDAALRQLVTNYPAAAREIVRQYLKALTESRLGN